MAVLRIVFTTLQVKRVLRLDGIYSEAAVTSRGILAGDGFATRLLRAQLMATLDGFAAEWW